MGKGLPALTALSAHGSDAPWPAETAQAEKVYVQHRMREHGAALYDLIERRGGNVYVCGDGASMAKVSARTSAPRTSNQHARPTTQGKIVMVLPTDERHLEFVVS